MTYSGNGKVLFKNGMTYSRNGNPRWQECRRHEESSGQGSEEGKCDSPQMIHVGIYNFSTKCGIQSTMSKEY